VNQKLKALVYKTFFTIQKLIGIPRRKIEQSEGSVGKGRENRSKGTQFWRRGALGECRDAYKWRDIQSCSP